MTLLNTNRIRIGGTPIDPADTRSQVDWTARWLKDPLFADAEYRELVHPGRSPDLNGEIQNVHTLFRRDWNLESKPIRQARLYITADDCYKLYVNGRFIGLGPAPAYPFDYPYNAWDVTAEARAGQTVCIGVHTYYQGMHSLTFPSADNLQGLLVQMEVDYEDGPSTTCVTDGHWRCLRTDAYHAGRVLGYQTAFSEDIDLRRFPHGWNQAGFDDSAWQAPCVCDIPGIYSLSPQKTPPVAVYKRAPERIIKKGPGHYFIDFGTELVGSTACRVNGAAGHQVEIRHGEETDGPDSVRYEMRCNCTYQEFCTLSGTPDEVLTFFDYKGFRYVEVLNWPEALTQERVWAYERHYPFPEKASGFTCSLPLLNDIWNLCRDGARVGTIDTYLDCPTREKGGFMGDGFVTGISHLVLTGDARILRKFLTDVANTRRYCPGLLSTAPNYVNGELAEYSLLWPVLLEYYYQWTGDRAFVREMMPVLAGLLRYYSSYENAQGLLQDVYSQSTGRYSVLVDWPKNLRDGYDDPYLMGERTIEDNPEGVVNTMVQGFYARALQSSERLASVADSAVVKQFVSGRIDRLQTAVLNHLRDPSTGLFVDRNGSNHSSLHANVTPLMAGMLSGEACQPVIEFIRRKRLSCGVYFSFFVLKSLYEQVEGDLAFDLLTSRDPHSWHSMLAAGATTCMEAWAPDLKWNTSWCHPWSSAPIAMVAHEMMGVRPGAPGWRTIRFAPRPPAHLDQASIRMTTPAGIVEASFKRQDDDIIYQLTVPGGCTAECLFVADSQMCALNDDPIQCVKEREPSRQDRVCLPARLPAGTHTITFSGN